VVDGTGGPPIFDPDSVDIGAVEWRTDLPAGSGRLYSQPVGIENVIVNGTEIVGDGRLTGGRPGKVLRRGQDTDDGAGRG
jgi:N-acyl-D-aspartate/D-glutamate deacylase